MSVLHHLPRLLLDERPGRVCTGLTAFWCPLCGDCTCERREDGERDDMTAEGCPLHDMASPHAKDIR